MNNFIVNMREVHIQPVRIENVATAEEAIEKAREGEGEQLELEYSHTLDSDVWTVEAVE